MQLVYIWEKLGGRQQGGQRGEEKGAQAFPESSRWAGWCCTRCCLLCAEQRPSLHSKSQALTCLTSSVISNFKLGHPWQQRYYLLSQCHNELLSYRGYSKSFTFTFSYVHIDKFPQRCFDVYKTTARRNQSPLLIKIISCAFDISQGGGVLLGVFWVFCLSICSSQLLRI